MGLFQTVIMLSIIYISIHSNKEVDLGITDPDNLRTVAHGKQKITQRLSIPQIRKYFSSINTNYSYPEYLWDTGSRTPENTQTHMCSSSYINAAVTYTILQYTLHHLEIIYHM